MPSIEVSTPATTVRSAVRLNVTLLGILGAAAVLAPVQLLRGFGVASAPFAVFGIIRVFAVFALLLAVVLWGARTWLESDAGQGTVRALAVAYAAGTVWLFVQQWTVWYGRTGLALVSGCAVLAISYGRAKSVSRMLSAPVP